mmetsp:Transcript_21285/g.59947  ORF Transcript_21285/g.59947 Transcript_21285/m.59947 type:complete len:258 (+) Transcript_21285:203-976(+)
MMEGRAVGVLYGGASALFMAPMLMTIYMIPLLWPALCYFVVAAAYAFNKPAWISLSSKSDSAGDIPTVIRILMSPFLGGAFIVWFAKRWKSPEIMPSRIVERVYLGRLPWELSEIPEDVVEIVDCTAEFPRFVTSNVKYQCFPMLDTCAPPESERDRFVTVARHVASFAIDGEDAVYVHCANGRGRSATLIAAALLAARLVDTVEEAQTVMRLQRPQVHLKACQKEFLNGILDDLRQGTVGVQVPEECDAQPGEERE